MPHNVGKGTRLSTTESLGQALRCLPRKKSILCACLHADLKLQASLLLLFRNWKKFTHLTGDIYPCFVPLWLVATPLASEPVLSVLPELRKTLT